MVIYTPSTFFTALEQQYQLLFPEDQIIWRKGKNALAQDTARIRVVMHVPGSVSVKTRLLYKQAESWQPEVDAPPTIQWDMLTVELHIYAPENILVSSVTPDGFVPGLRDRVLTALRQLVLGPFDYASTDVAWVDLDYSIRSDARIQHCVYVFELPMPVFDVLEVAHQVPAIITEVSENGTIAS